MTPQEWLVQAGLLVSVLIAVMPWMAKVHAKLAVIASKIAHIAAQLERAAESHHELAALSTRHEARLERHGTQIAHLMNSLGEA